MNSTTMTLLLPMIVAAVATPPAAAQAPGSLQERLMGLEQGAMERWRQGDPMGWAEISAPEVTYVDPGLAKPIVGIEAYTKYLEALKGKVSYQGSEFLDPKVVQVGDLAVMTYNYRATSRHPDGTVKGGRLWNTTEVYARRGETWRIVHTHWSYVDHTPPDTLEMPLPVVVRESPATGVLGELMALERAAMERWRQGDPWGFTEISAPGVTYFDSGTPRRVDGLDALKREYAAVAGKVSFAVMDFVEPAVQVHGDAAVLLYRFLSTRLRADGSVERRTPWTCTEVYARSAGVWRIVHTHWSHIHGRAKAAGPGAEE